jgi:hypothetical protein
MAYSRTRSEGSFANTGTTGAGLAPTLPNTGTSVIGNSSAEAWVLQAPYAGCRKRVIFTHLTSANLNILRSCTTSGGSPCFVGATTGINTLTLTTIRAGFATVVDLEGINSTLWAVTNVFPGTSVAVAALTSA